MKKYLLSFLIMTLVSTISFAQATQQKLDEVKKDPKTIENAAKADARLINKKNIVDSSSAKNIKARKENGCKFKRKNKSSRKSL